jgi:signal transduction histidine kinase
MTALYDRLPRPLDSLTSFKMKTGLVVVTALFFASVTFWFTARWPFRYALAAALIVSLIATQVVAHGMTSPLREMTAAARAMMRGDYSRRVRATSRDEIGELAAAFNQMSSDLEEADRYRRELIGNVSHELRTPITALRGVLENVVDGVQEPTEATLRSALAQTERLGSLVTELLDLSRLEGGALALSKSTFRVQDVLAEDIDNARLAHPSATILLEVSPPDLTAVADTARVHQVVVNLLDNAIRHSPPGQTVSVTAWTDRATGGLIVEVADRGPGIARADRARVFERFTRGGSTDGGTGLGLAIARWAVDLHGGSIEVVDADSIGPGCRIRVTLPPAVPSPAAPSPD